MNSTDNPAPRPSSWPRADPPTWRRVELRAGTPVRTRSRLTRSAQVDDEPPSPPVSEMPLYVGFSEDMWC